jgi:hypothetical protein
MSRNYWARPGSWCQLFGSGLERLSSNAEFPTKRSLTCKMPDWSRFCSPPVVVLALSAADESVGWVYSVLLVQSWALSLMDPKASEESGVATR